MIPNGTNAKKYALTPRSAMTPRPVFISINTLQSTLGKRIPESENSTPMIRMVMYAILFMAFILPMLFAP